MLSYPDFSDNKPQCLSRVKVGRLSGTSTFHFCTRSLVSGLTSSPYSTSVLSSIPIHKSPTFYIKTKEVCPAIEHALCLRRRDCLVYQG